jgi:hypothetical protein
MAKGKGSQTKHGAAKAARKLGGSANAAAAKVAERPKSKAKQEHNKRARKKSDARADPGLAKKAKKRKLKLIDDKFTMPEPDYQLIDTLKNKCFVAGIAVKKNELLRVGLRLLNNLEMAQLEAKLKELEPVKKKKGPNKQSG